MTLSSVMTFLSLPILQRPTEMPKKITHEKRSKKKHVWVTLKLHKHWIISTWLYDTLFPTPSNVLCNEDC